MREILNALPNPRATLKPTGIAVSIIIIARFPASLPVSGYARLCRSPQPAIFFVFCVLQSPRPRGCYRFPFSFSDYRVYGVYTPVFRWPGEFRFCFFETRLPDAMAKSVRSVAIELHENAKAIEAWRRQGTGRRQSILPVFHSAIVARE
jgi:hypothetical protein